MCKQCCGDYCTECGKPTYMRNCDHCRKVDDANDDTELLEETDET